METTRANLAAFHQQQLQQQQHQQQQSAASQIYGTSPHGTAYWKFPAGTIGGGGGGRGFTGIYNGTSAGDMNMSAAAAAAEAQNGKYPVINDGMIEMDTYANTNGLSVSH